MRLKSGKIKLLFMGFIRTAPGRNAKRVGLRRVVMRFEKLFMVFQHYVNSK